MSKKNLLKRILGVVLAASMVFNAAVIPVHAEPVVDNGTAEELQIDEDADQGISVGDADEENDIIDDTATAEDEVVEDNAVLESDLLDDEDLDESELEVDLENVFYRALTADEMDAKDALYREVNELNNAAEGEDYAEDELIYCCDSEEEAEEVAKAYAEATGYDVSVAIFEYGVATLRIKKTKYTPEYNSSSSVVNIMKFAADDNNNLPAVHANGRSETSSIPAIRDHTSTKNEIFKDQDPFLKAGTTEYQWFHNMVNDKYIWETEGYADKIDNVYVAVVDTGIDDTNEDLSSAIAYTDGFWKDQTANPKSTEPLQRTCTDEDGHGTNVAGIVGAVPGNGIGGRGVAAGVKIVALRVFSKFKENGEIKFTAYSDDTIRALNLIIDKKKNEGFNIRVVNMSLGGTMYNQDYCDAIKDCEDNGILVIAAAGNENTNAPQYPAAYESAMSVAALNSDYGKARFSNYGSTVDIAAPGGENRFNPETGNPYVEVLYSTGTTVGERTDGVSSMAGTSQATPVVSSVAAMVFAKYSDLKPRQVRDRLKNTAKPVNSSYAIGTGCVDAMAALDLEPVLEAPLVYEAEGTEPLNENQVIAPGTSVRLEPKVSDACVVYYTLNGKNPNPDDLVGTDTKIYNKDDEIKLVDSGKITLKVLNTIYGNTSKIGTYNFTVDTSKIHEIKITSSAPLRKEGENYFYEVAEGKKINLLAEITPSNAKNKTLKWESSDPTIATVNAKGQITGVSSGEGEVTISVTATDSDTPAYESVNVRVMALAHQVEVVSPSDPLEVNIGEPKDISGDVNVYPIEASQAVVYKSSKPAIASVDANGVISAIKTGVAVITVTAADGSGVKDTISVKVKTPVTGIELEDPSGLYILASGKTFTPKIIFNEGKSVPDNKNVTWSVSSSEITEEDLNKYISIDEKKGTIKLDESWGSNGKITVTAVSEDDERVVGNLDIDLYPVTKILVNTAPLKLYGPLYVGRSAVITTNWDNPSTYACEVLPENAYNKLKWSSSNPKVASVNQDGTIWAHSYGTVTITAETLDGSKKKATFKLQVLTHPDELKLKEELGNNVIYPGKTIKYELNEKGYNYSVGIYNSDDNTYYFEGDYDYFEIADNKIKAKSKMAELEEMQLSTVGLLRWEVYYDYSIRGWNREYNRITTFPLEMYPAGTSAVVLHDGEDNVVKDVTLNPNEWYFINASSSPANACQKYYTYTSNNPKVATVNSNGVVKAVANGKAKITVKAGDGSGKSTVLNVTVSRKVTKVDIASKSGTDIVTPGKSLQLVATVNADAVNKKVKWELADSKDSKYGSISASGQFKANSRISDFTKLETVTVKATATDGSDVYDTFDIRVAPAITGFDVVEPVEAPIKKEETVTFTVETIGNKLGDDFDITVKSSKTSVATVTYDAVEELEGLEKQFNINVKGVGAGSADITVTAKDGSGVSSKYTLKFVVPVSSLAVRAKTSVYALTPGKSTQLVADVNKDASDKGIIWTIDEDNSTGQDFILHDGKGKISLPKNVSGEFDGKTVRVVAKPNDGSELPDYPYADIVLRSASSGKVILSANSIETLCVGDDIGDLRNSKDFTVSIEGRDTARYTASSSKSDIVSVTFTDDVISVSSTGKTGKAVVTVMSDDGSSSAKFTVVTVNPVRQLAISSKTGAYKAADGTKLQMVATANSNATSKAVKWSVDKDKQDIANISAKGELKISGVTDVQTVVVITATASDGSGVTATKSITVYPKTLVVSAKAYDVTDEGRLVLKSDNVINAGENMVIAFSGTKAGYTVKYTTGSARACYYNKGDDTTAVRVYGLKAGKCTVTATANDGSGQKITYNVIIK